MEVQATPSIEATEVAPTGGVNTIPSNAEAIALAEKAMADKINKDVKVDSSAPDLEKVSTPEEVKKPEPQDPATKRLAYLAKKEKEILQKDKRARTGLSQIQALTKQLEQERAQYRAFFDGLSDPQKAMQVLASRGLTYDKMTEAQLQGRPVDTTAVQLRALQEQQESFQKQIIEHERQKAEEAAKQAQASAEETISNFQGDIASFVDQNKDTYKMLHLYHAEDAAQQVYEVAAKYFEVHGKTLTIKEATEMTNAYFQKHYDGLQKALAPPKPKEAPQAPKSEFVTNVPKQAQKTLTNDMNTGMSTQTASTLPSEGEAIRRALAKLGRAS